MNASFGAIEPGHATHQVIHQIASAIRALMEGDVTDREFLKAYDTSVQSLAALHWMLASSALETVREKISDEAFADWQESCRMRSEMETEDATELRYTELIQGLAIPIPPQLSAMGDFLRSMMDDQDGENG